MTSSTPCVVLASVGFWAPVVFARPGDDHKPEILKFRARFRHLKKSARRALDHRIVALRLTADMRSAMQAQIDDPITADFVREDLQRQLLAKPIPDTEMLDEILVDWDLHDREGKFMPYSRAARVAQEEELDGLEAAIVRAYIKAQQESLNPSVIEKNSEEPSGTGS